MNFSGLERWPVGRRGFLAGLATGPLGYLGAKGVHGWAGNALAAETPPAEGADTFPAEARTVPTDPDIVIVGAGAAGLAAAWALARRGVSFVLVEARDRIGGRALTDTRTFGVPFDAGCSWIYQADHNPLTNIARRRGFDLIPHERPHEHLHTGAGHATSSDLLAYDVARREITLALRSIGRTGKDVSAAHAVPTTMDPVARVAANWIGPFDIGADLDEFSAVDWWNLDLTWPSFLVRQGYGAVIADRGAQVPVRLSTAVTAVRWGAAEGVTVETTAGTISAKACIVTVSTGVLQSERIRFDPPLPAPTISAIDSLPMGLLVKIPMQFDGERFGMPANGWLSYATASSNMLHFLTWPADTNLVVGFAGGRFAWELTRSGAEAAIDFALAELRKIIGTAIDSHFLRASMTRWGTDELSRGAFAYARPGAAQARAALHRPLNDRLYFAGEALGGGMAMTCGGAVVSGNQVAADAAKQVLDGSSLYGRRWVSEQVAQYP